MEITGLLAAGMGAAFLGSVKVPLARKLEIDEDRVGGLVSTFGLAMIPVVLVMGFLGDLVGHQLVTISGAILMVASLVVLANAKKYWLALGGVLLGIAATRADAKLDWDAQKMEFTNLPEANRFVNPPYRDGWSL